MNAAAAAAATSTPNADVMAAMGAVEEVHGLFAIYRIFSREPLREDLKILVLTQL